MNEYAITLRHDRGRSTIHTWASSPEQATKQVCDYELAPLCAVKKVRLIGSKKKGA